MDSMLEVVSYQQRRLSFKKPSKNYQEPVPTGLSDSFKILDPSCRKLNGIETQRIMAVFTEAITKIELISLFPIIIENLDRFRVSLGSECVELFERHKVLMESFDEIKLYTSKLLDEQEKEEEFGSFPDPFGIMNKQMDFTAFTSKQDSSSTSTEPSSFTSDISISNKTKTNEALDSLQFVATEIQTNCKNIFRALYKNATTTAVVDKILGEYGKQRNKHASRLLMFLGQLKEHMMGKLLMTASEEREKDKYVEQLFEREKENTLRIQQLEENLYKARNEMQKYINKKNDTIRSIQSDLEHVESQADENYRRTRTEAEKQIISDIQVNESKVTRLNQEKINLQKKLESITREHKVDEQDMRKRRFKTETELDNWIHKYDQDMETRQHTLEELQGTYSDIREQLRELEEVFAVLEAEYKAITEERRLKKEADERERQERTMRLHAARVLQRFWRKYGTPPKKKKKKGKKK